MVHSAKTFEDYTYLQKNNDTKTDPPRAKTERPKTQSNDVSHHHESSCQTTNLTYKEGINTPTWHDPLAEETHNGHNGLATQMNELLKHPDWLKEGPNPNPRSNRSHEEEAVR